METLHITGRGAIGRHDNVIASSETRQRSHLRGGGTSQRQDNGATYQKKGQVRDKTTEPPYWRRDRSEKRQRSHLKGGVEGRRQGNGVTLTEEWKVGGKTT